MTIRPVGDELLHADRLIINIPGKGWASSWRYGEDPIASLQERPKIPESTENEWNEQGSGVRVLLLSENIKNSVSLLVSSNEVGPEVHGQKTKYILMSFNRDAQQNHNTHTNTTLKMWQNSMFRYKSNKELHQNT
jgi:hypothetical protein